MFYFVTDQHDQKCTDQTQNADSRLKLMQPARNRVDWIRFIISLALMSFFFVFYGDQCSLSFTFISWLLTLASLTFYFFEKPGDSLCASKIASILYAASFAVAPVWISHHAAYSNPYFGNDIDSLMEKSAAVTLTGYCFFICGYYIFKALFRHKGFETTETENVHHTAWLRSVGLLATIIGIFCYVKVMLNSGGLFRLLSYSEGRADIFSGVYGGWFWGAHYLFLAYGIFTVIQIKRHPLLMLLGAILLAAMFFPFQGRDLVVAPLFCWLVFYHTLHSPLKAKQLVIGLAAIVLLSSVLGAYRSNSSRANTNDFLSTYVASMEEHLIKVITANIEQLDIVMTSVRYIDLTKKPIGPMVLFSWFEPFDRALLGDIVPSIHSGIFIDLLLVPEHYSWNTAASPSLPGELFIGMSWLGLCLGLATYGAVFSLFDRWKALATRNLLLFSAYPFVVFICTKMIVDGTAHFFRLIIILAPVFFISLATSKKREPKFIQERT